MARFFRGLHFGLITIILGIGFLVNLILLLSRSNYSSKKEMSTNDNNGNGIEFDSLQLPETVNEKALLLGKKSPHKMKLAFAMVLSAEATGKQTFPEVIHEIIRQDPKPNGSKSLIIVLLLCEFRKVKMEEILATFKKDLGESLMEGYVQLVVSPFDSNLETFYELESRTKSPDVSRTTAKMNLRLSFLMRYCAGVADNVMTINMDAKPVGGALKIIYKQIDEMPGNTLEVIFDDTPNGRMYSSKFLSRVYSTLFSMAFLGTSGKISSVVAHSSINETSLVRKEKQLFTKLKSEHNNPPAAITATIDALGTTKLTNSYLGTGITWFASAREGDTFTVQLQKPDTLKRIAIDTGLDSFMRDPFVGANVELSYKTDAATGKCTEYSVAKSFEETPSIEISFDVHEDKPMLLKPVHCIRIKVTETHKEWCAIKAIVIEPRAETR